MFNVHVVRVGDVLFIGIFLKTWTRTFLGCLHTQCFHGYYVKCPTYFGIEDPINRGWRLSIHKYFIKKVDSNLSQLRTYPIFLAQSPRSSGWRFFIHRYFFEKVDSSLSRLPTYPMFSWILCEMSNIFWDQSPHKSGLEIDNP